MNFCVGALGVALLSVGAILVFAPASVSFPVRWGDDIGEFDGRVAASCGPAVTAMMGIGISPAADGPRVFRASPWWVASNALTLCQEHVWWRAISGEVLVAIGVVVFLSRRRARGAGRSATRKWMMRAVALVLGAVASTVVIASLFTPTTGRDMWLLIPVTIGIAIAVWRLSLVADSGYSGA